MKPKTVGRNDGRMTARRHVESSNGIMPGTLILTLDGALPVETLVPGDKIITRNTGLVELKAISHELEICETVRIRAGSLGHDRPDSDTILPSRQKVLIRDWRAKALYYADQAMVDARRLVDGEYVRLQPRAQHMVFRLGFESPQVIYADGLELACATAPVMAD
ncbi:Hint domain-containing protein [Thalassovita sp.]|uniref:Hint domain-containing protein n=1 Tax=Thalassovita sp. TaxID=1979401 RepID=UPI002B27A964|nr:Hint domain-containing protein [Thalassovita sp.]